MTELQPTSYEIWERKYQLKDNSNHPVDKTPEDTFRRVAKALAAIEANPDEYESQFFDIMVKGATPAGRIMSNVGALEYKPSTSTINCTVSSTISDSMEGIMHSLTEAALTLKAGCGIGYEFSTLRPKGAFVTGAGALTSGPIPFMDIFDKMCFTVSSAGGRRGAQMATFAVWHPDVEEFIKAKREDGRLRQFNMSLLIDDEFMEAVKNDSDWQLFFPVTQKELNTGLVSADNLIQKPLFWDKEYCEKSGYIVKDVKVTCRVYKTIKAVELWDIIMKATYDYAEPGFLLIDSINRLNPNNFCENIRATNPCVTGDTVVATETGNERIKDLVEKFNIESPVKVLSFNILTGDLELQPVTFAGLTREHAEIIEIELDTGQVLKLTPDHKVYTTNRGYVKANDISSDDDIVTL